MQTADNIKPCYPLFRDDDYKENLAKKRDQFEEGHAADKVYETFMWSTTQEYQDLNFKREALTVDPAKACQPLGAVLCASGFHKTLPYVHGSQGCVAYFRSYFNRHFKEPCSCVSDSMTEDAAVFGGQKNMFDGLANAKALYKPDIIAVSTTCMAEVIGDDLNAFINNSKKEGHIPDDFPVPFAHTPSFVGSHVTGWDNMEEGILRYFTLNDMAGKVVGSNGKVNVVPGFETYLGNYRVIKRMLADMGVGCTMLSDPSEVFDTPADGEFRMYSGGTTIDEVKDAPNAITTILLQPFQLEKTKKFVEGTWNHEVPKLNIPMGVEWTDEFLMSVSEATGKPIPAALELERGRCMDLISDSHAWLHGKKLGSSQNSENRASGKSCGFRVLTSPRFYVHSTENVVGCCPSARLTIEASSRRGAPSPSPTRRIKIVLGLLVSEVNHLAQNFYRVSSLFCLSFIDG